MKKLLGMIFAILTTYFLFAGDAAAFVDLGFSDDCKTYVFGQYGKTDKNFQAYSEIFCVDVEKNDFIDNGIFHASDKSGRTGKEVFEELKTKQSWFLNKYKLKSVLAESVLYIRSDSKKSTTDEILFKDYESSSKDNEIFYAIRLMPLYEGNGATTKSSFYIVLEKRLRDGSMISRKVIGNPAIKRKGVTNYAIDKIFLSPDGNGIVFLVEKTVSDSTGISIRYMVETAKIK